MQIREYLRSFKYEEMNNKDKIKWESKQGN